MNLDTTIEQEIMLALSKSDYDTLRQLLNSSNINEPLDSFGNRPIHLAALKMDIDMIEFLVMMFGADISILNSTNWSPLTFIVLRNDPNINKTVGLLVKLGATIKNGKSPFENLALEYAKSHKEENPNLYNFLESVANSDLNWEKHKAAVFLRHSLIGPYLL
ncbi:unnamed protein product [Blepharisma stoltei]|uniref:Ankyrin repeat domain-containing protein n=1 Tax=Blepharisma stoltei TaxID=1481888 RepID=A0AAU9JCG6_9CILI|nr:unnamed protein product [Blepharisma stoltei]